MLLKAALESFFGLVQLPRARQKLRLPAIVVDRPRAAARPSFA